MASTVDPPSPHRDRSRPQSFDVDGNRLTPMPDGPDRLDALVRLIDEAKHSLRLLYYIYAPDAAGRRVRSALQSALDRGVTVSLIVDGFGSSADADFFRPIENAGATVCRFLPRFGRRYLLRNHQKLALADESQVIVGGFNIQDDYFGTIDTAWRDLGLLVEGSAAARLARYFDALACWTKTPNAKIRDLRRILSAGSEHGGSVRWLMGGPTRWLSPWALSVKRDLKRARRLDMIAAYFAPNPAMLRRIERVARRGGTAQVMTAAKSDNNATIAAARHTYARMLRRGVLVFEYLPIKLHTKLFVIDNVVHLGSANFDVRSLYLNLELMLRVEDAAFAAHMRNYAESERTKADQITAENHGRAGVIQRLRWSLAYFLVAVVDTNITRRLNFGIDGR